MRSRRPGFGPSRSRRRPLPDPDWIDRAARRYAFAGRFDRAFVRGKLRRDPVYAAVVEGGLLPVWGTLVDLGCGRGILLASLFESGSVLRLVGIEHGRTAEVAGKAVSDVAEIRRDDVRRAAVPPCAAAVLIDVLHYLDPEAQEALVEKIAASLRPSGVLVVREADAGAGRRFTAVRVAERLATCLRGRPFQTLRYRSETEWGALLRRAGLEVESRPMGEGTPFANVLIVGRKPRGFTPPGSASSPSSPR